MTTPKPMKPVRAWAGNVNGRIDWTFTRTSSTGRRYAIYPTKADAREDYESRDIVRVLITELPPRRKAGPTNLGFCSQCGQDYSARECGPTHAIKRLELAPRRKVRHG